MHRDNLRDVHSIVLDAAGTSRRRFLQNAGGAVLFGLGGGVLVGCSGQASSPQAAQGPPKKGGVVHAALNTDAPTIDWTSSTATITRAIAWHIFEQLFAFDNAFSLRPMIAEGFEVSDDKLTYTIKVRQGVKFHDGATVTAEDVVASIKRWGAISGGGQETVGRIKDIKAVDDATVEINLDSVFTPLIGNLADVKQALIILPAKVAEAAGEKPLEDDQLIGTGPYQFVSWARGREVVLKRFPGYVGRTEDWGGLTGKKTAYFDEIRGDIVKDTQVRLNQLQTDQSQFALELTLDMYKPLQSFPEAKPVIISPNSWLALIPNKSRPPFDDVRMRQAANYALNKTEISKAAYGNERFWKVDGSIFFPEQKDLYTTDGTENYDVHDPAKAKQLLAEAGYKGEPLRFMVTNLYPDHYNGAQVMVRQLEAAGFKIDLQVMEWPTLLSRREEKDAFDLFVTSFSPSFDPTVVIWFSSDWPGWYESDKIAELLDEWVKADGDAEKKRLLAEMNRVVYDEVPVIKISNSAGLQGRSTKMAGYTSWIDMRLWNTGFSSAQS